MFLDKYEGKAISNYDVFNLLDGKTRILTYPELTKYKNIESVLEPFNCCVLLYMTKEGYGHWCCLIRHPNKIEFFDPYGRGNLPDEELKYIPENFRQKSNQEYPHLTKLLYDSKLPIEYNHHPFQKLGGDTKTCGRHCAVRLIFKDMELEDYHKYIKNNSKKLGIDTDQLVTMLTIN